MSNNQPENILVIDDDEINNFISKKLIKKASKDTRITVCLNGKSALDTLTEIQEKGGKFPEFIFVDLTMRIMDGWGFLDSYKNLDCNLMNKCTIVILTSSVFKHDMRRASEHKVNSQYIIKPLTSERLKLLFEQS